MLIFLKNWKNGRKKNVTPFLTMIKAGKISKSPAFKSKTTLTKAVKWASQALPKSPPKWSVVIHKLSFQINMAEYAEPLSLEQGGRWGISAEVEKCVKNFYERCDNSREAPGKQDTIKVTIDGSKITCQKKTFVHNWWTFFLPNWWNLFKEEYPIIKIGLGRSKFAELRPTYVLLSSAIPTHACVCPYHEYLHFMLLLDELQKVNKTIPTYSMEFVQSLVCNPDSKLYWKNLCNKCKDSSLLDQYYVSSDHILLWFSWQNATLPNGKEKLQKLSFQGSFDAFSELKLQTPTFLMHHFVKEKQSPAFKMDHDFSDTNFDTAVLQNDFAENYSQMG